MSKINAWALQTKQGKFINFPHHNLPYFEAYRIMTFRTRRQAAEWLANDRFWNNKAEPVMITITTKGRGSI